MEVAAPAPSSVDRPWRRALAWLAFLGPFFFLTYGLANWLASVRGGVGAIVFDWERQIPFAAWMIVPYWSIDLFYALSLFVCATRAELDTHAKRLVCAQVISVVCFLLFPLRFTFERPPVDGAFGFMFDVLTGFDQPYNQAPSLHIALLVILWVLYARHVARPWRWLLHGWFALIGISILTTWQHHFFDLPTGIWVGWLSVWLFPHESESLLATVRLSTEPRRRALALRYGTAAVLTGAIALGAGGGALWLLWAAGTLAMVAMIYLLLDAGAFQKRADGSMAAASWWLLAPYFAGAWLNSRWWTRGTAVADVIVPGLLLGRLPRRAEREALGISAAVDLTAELPFASAGVGYANVAQLDLTPPTPEQLARWVQAIDRAFARGPVLVCCALGFSRSAAAAAAWLLASGHARDVAQAVALVRGARRGVVLGSAYIQALESYARKLAEQRA